MTPDTALSIVCGVLLIALVWLSLMLVSGIDWAGQGRRLRRWYINLDNDTKKFLLWMGRVLKIYVMIWIGLR